MRQLFNSNAGLEANPPQRILGRAVGSCIDKTTGCRNLGCLSGKITAFSPHFFCQTEEQSFLNLDSSLRCAMLDPRIWLVILQLVMLGSLASDDASKPPPSPCVQPTKGRFFYFEGGRFLWLLVIFSASPKKVQPASSLFFWPRIPHPRVPFVLMCNLGNFVAICSFVLICLEVVSRGRYPKIISGKNLTQQKFSIFSAAQRSALLTRLNANLEKFFFSVFA